MTKGATYLERFHEIRGAGDGRRDLRQRQGNLPACAPLANPYVPFQLQNPERYKPGCAIIRGTLFPGLDLPLAGQENTQELRQTALHTLQELGFAINELGLYLDTHRSDSDAVELYNQYVELYGHQLQQMEQNGMALTPDGSLQ